MSKISMPIYLTDEQRKELREYHQSKYPHMSLYAMIVDLALKGVRGKK